MLITIVELSQLIDLTVETEEFSENLETIVEGLYVHSMIEQSYKLEDLWDDVHPETLEGIGEFFTYLEELNNYVYDVTLMDPRSLLYPGGPKALPGSKTPIEFLR